MVMVMAKPVIYTQTMNVYHNIVRYRPRTTEEKRSAEEKGQVNCHALSYSPVAIIVEYSWENDFALIEKNTEYYFWMVEGLRILSSLSDLYHHLLLPDDKTEWNVIRWNSGSVSRSIRRPHLADTIQMGLYLLFPQAINPWRSYRAVAATAIVQVEFAAEQQTSKTIIITDSEKSGLVSMLHFIRDFFFQINLTAKVLF